jgi:HEPN domain-containing protein
MRDRGDLVRGWLKKARHDRVTAEREMETENPLTDIACFHAQQAVEKGLKAVLTAEGITPPRTHVLEDLGLLAARRMPELERFVEELAQLTPYAVATRYPEFAEPDLHEAEVAVGIAGRVLALIDSALQDKGFQR